MSWLIFVLLAVVAASAREILQKKALQAEHTLEYLVIRGWFMTVLSLVLLPWVDFSMSFRGYLYAVVVAIIAAIGIMYRNKALKHIDISIVQPLMNIGPVFVLVLAFIFLGETVTWVQFAGLMLLVVGTYYLELDSEHKGFMGPMKHLAENKYAVMVILAVFLFSVTNVFDKFILTNYTDFISYLVIVWFMTNAIFFGYYASKYPVRRLFPILKMQGKYIFWPALLTIPMFLFLYKAFTLAAVSLVVAVFRMESLVATIQGGRFFHEDNLWQKTCACGIMVAGAVLVIL